MFLTDITYVCNISTLSPPEKVSVDRDHFAVFEEDLDEVLPSVVVAFRMIGAFGI